METFNLSVIIPFVNPAENPQHLLEMFLFSCYFFPSVCVCNCVLMSYVDKKKPCVNNFILTPSFALLILI